MTSLNDVLFTKTQRKVLALLFGKPDQRFFTNEIVRSAAMGRGTICRELKRLAEAEIIVSSREGNQLYYQANEETPIYKELLGIVRKTFGVVDLIREALTPLDDAISLAFIYGSIAKSNDTKNSDIDLMLVGEALVYGEVMEYLTEVEAQVGRDINPTIYTKEQFAERIEDEHSFTLRIMKQDKLMIKGIIDDTRKPV